MSGRLASGLSSRPIREWDYDGPGLEARIVGRCVEIRQFDGWGEMRLQVCDRWQARELAATLEAFASKEDGLHARAEEQHRRIRAEHGRST